MEPLLILGGRIIDPSQGIDMVGDLLIAEGGIAWVGKAREAMPEEPFSLLHAEGMVVSPGFIDLHCHLREPGFEEKETIATGTRAAARGGFTTICCMPNTEPPIDTRATVEFIQRKAAAEGVVRVLPIGCISKGRRGEEMVEMGELAGAGVVALSDDGNPVMDSRLMRYALEYSRFFDLVLIDHCEDVSLSEGGVINEGWLSTRLGLKGIPAAAEEIMVARDIALAEMTGGRVHIAHVSTAGSADLVRRAKEKGIPVTAEVTPHHLTLTEERVMGYDTNAKVNPPLRSAKDVQALIGALKQGVIDAIVTDHAPREDVDKMCEYDIAAFGISGLETALGSLLTLVHGGEIDLATLISKLTFEPAKILRKSDLGTLRVGACGDVTIFDPMAEWVVDPSAFASKGKNTPLAGCLLKGKVMATICRGEVVYKEDAMKIETISREAGARFD
ncbi:MAG: dihydroorotase [Dehalococcoidia bacterium]|nr:MAG: dihydroorotase [Dehalococcoidia bacterium]